MSGQIPKTAVYCIRWFIKLLTVNKRNPLNGGAGGKCLNYAYIALFGQGIKDIA